MSWINIEKLVLENKTSLLTMLPKYAFTMNLKSRCPQCNSVRIIEIMPSNIGSTFDLNKARCDSYGYKYGSDWKDLV
jgi:hypothetical protein